MGATSVLIADSLKALLPNENTFLMRGGVEVLTAEDGARAVELAREKVPRLILLDLEMRRMDGAAACAAMRPELSLAFTPILIMRGIDSPEIPDRCLRGGCTQLVGKPPEPDRPLAILVRILSMRERKTPRVPLAL